MSVFIVKRGEKYLRFNSSRATELDDPERASLYSRFKDAEYQVHQRHWLYGKSQSFDPREKYVVEVDFRVVSEREASPRFDIDEIPL